MGHHHHDHQTANYNRAFAIGVALNVGFVILEAVFGVLVGSLALLADAGHNLSDVLGLFLAWCAHWLTQIKPTERRTYGWRSSTILAALFNSLILMAVIGGIVWEAFQRFGDAQTVAGATVMWVAGVGFVINSATALLFFKGRKGDLNIKGAFLHMAADAGVSLGVVLAGLGIYSTGWTWIDPVTSIAVAMVIFLSSWELLRDSMNLALHAVPDEIDIGRVREYLIGLEGVEEIHDMHIWAMSTTETALTVHLVRPNALDDDQLLAEAARGLRDQFHIEHSTIQIERNAQSARCQQAGADSL